MTNYIIISLILFQSLLILKFLKDLKSNQLLNNKLLNSFKELNNDLGFKTMTKNFYLTEIDRNLDQILLKLNVINEAGVFINDYFFIISGYLEEIDMQNRIILKKLKQISKRV